MKKETRSFSNFGFSTILLSFVMICVVTFSALSLVTANSDYKLSKKVADKTTLYYAAQEAAYAKLQGIDEILIDCYRSSPREDIYFAQLETLLAGYGNLTCEEGVYSLTFTETIADNQHLNVRLLISYPRAQTDTFLEIVEWKSVYTRENPQDAFLDLI